MDCKSCKETKSNVDKIPYIVFESSQARQERHIKRLIVALIMAIVLMFVTNAMWLYVFQSYDYTSTETSYTQDGQGTNIIDNENEVNNGAETTDFNTLED